LTNPTSRGRRIFKTAWFAKAVMKARLTDAELCEAIEQVLVGRADSLGGGVFKKRLGKNRYRSIILAKGRQWWVYEYLFAKRDRENIDHAELQQFRKLAEVYETLTETQVAQLLKSRDFTEICHAQDATV
jgi:hypothetical protein